MSKIYKYTVDSVQKSTENTLAVLLHADNEANTLSFRPGQYAVISYFKNRRPSPARCFSIVSSPTDDNLLQFGIRIGGNYTRTLAKSIEPGSKMIVEGPFGNFIFNPERDQRAVFIAGGIGITPFISMLRYASRLRLPNGIALIYSCRSQDDVAFLDDLKLIQRVNPLFEIQIVLSKEGPVDKLNGLSVAFGHVDQSLLDKLLGAKHDNLSFFLCGPPGFMSSIETGLAASGVPASRIKSESFGQGVGPHNLRQNLSAQVYIATGLSLALGSITLLARDVSTTMTQPTAYDSPSQNQTLSSTTSNSRQDTVNQQIQHITNSSQLSNNTNPSSPSPNPTPGSPSPSPSPKPNPSPSPTPNPSPSPSPSPSPGPTPPPPPPKQVAPSLSFSASSTKITSGKSTTLSWSINSNASAPVSCIASGGWSGSKATSGSITVSPTSNTTYTLMCSNSAGSSSKSVSITVAPACVSTPSKKC